MLVSFHCNAVCHRPRGPGDGEIWFLLPAERPNNGTGRCAGASAPDSLLAGCCRQVYSTGPAADLSAGARPGPRRSPARRLRGGGPRVRRPARQVRLPLNSPSPIPVANLQASVRRRDEETPRGGPVRPPDPQQLVAVQPVDRLAVPLDVERAERRVLAVDPQRRRSTTKVAGRTGSRPCRTRSGVSSPSSGGPTPWSRAATMCRPRVQVPSVPHAASAVAHGSRDTAMYGTPADQSALPRSVK